MLNQRLFELFEKTVLSIRGRKDYIWMPHEVETLLAEDFHKVQSELDAAECERDRRVVALEMALRDLRVEQTAVSQLQEAIAARTVAEKAAAEAQQEVWSLK